MSPLVLCVGAALAQSAPTLEQAYQKEYAYLNAERAELEARETELEAEARARTSAAERELDQLQARLVAATRRADQAEDDFEALERETAAMDDASSLLSSTVNQASEVLGLGAPADATAALPGVFQAAVARLGAQAAVGWREDSFFLPDGELTSGRIYTWGQIASWGVSAQGSGALAPAGEGRMQLRRAFGVETAAALAADQQPERVEVYLYEAEKKAEEAEKSSGLRQVLTDAGRMGQFVFSLGVVSAILTLIRAITLLFARRGGMGLVKTVTGLVAEGRYEHAQAAAGSTGGPVARLLRDVLAARALSRDELDRVVDQSILRETPGIDRFASALQVITAGAPLFGLLGTVTGMIATFDVITEHGTGNPKLMSAGIAEALICTALGLAVAIPTLLAGNVLASVADGIKNTLDRGALGLLNALEAEAARSRTPPREERP